MSGDETLVLKIQITQVKDSLKFGVEANQLSKAWPWRDYKSFVEHIENRVSIEGNTMSIYCRQENRKQAVAILRDACVLEYAKDKKKNTQKFTAKIREICAIME